MKISISITGIFFFLLLQCLSAQKYDYQWPTGYNYGDTMSIFGISILDFTSANINTSAFAEIDRFSLGNNGSFICDKDGKLMLLTNNCGVYNKNITLISGGDTLTPGAYFIDFCLEYGLYPLHQTSLIVPEISNDSVFYIIHKDGELSNVHQNVISKNFYLSVVVKKKDGSFYLKEKKLLANEVFLAGKLTACINKEGNKWWTWILEYDTNRFYKFLIGGQDLVEGPFVQEIGEPLAGLELGIGQTTFSPDASMLALNSEANKIILYDFDNETGEMSNYRTISYPDDNEFGNGLAFSFDSKLLYLTTIHNLYQVDLTDSSVFHLGYFESFDEDGWPVVLGNMYLGPDCRIYVSPGSTTYYLHVIHQPNKKGFDCAFQERAIRMPTNISHDIPNLPMYRFDGACDSTILFPVVNVSEEPLAGDDAGGRVVPNPASGESVTLAFARPLPQPGEWVLYNQLGQPVRRERLSAGLQEQMFSLVGLPAGLYFWSVAGQGVRGESGKLIISK